jgi:hypothetical protein
MIAGSCRESDRSGSKKRLGAAVGEDPARSWLADPGFVDHGGILGARPARDFVA